MKDVKDVLSSSLNKSLQEIDRQTRTMEEIHKLSIIEKEVSAIDSMNRAWEAAKPWTSVQDSMNSGSLFSAMQSVASPAFDVMRAKDLACSPTLSPFPEHYVPSDFAIKQPIIPPNPVHKTNKHLEETNRHLQQTVDQLKEFIAQSKETGTQNVKMIRLSVASLVFTILSCILGTIIGVLSYQAGKEAATPTAKVAPSNPGPNKLYKKDRPHHK